MKDATKPFRLTIIDAADRYDPRVKEIKRFATWEAARGYAFSILEESDIIEMTFNIVDERNEG